MFNPLRLFRRNEHIDDPATAYIEGRATERDEEALSQRAAREPELMSDLDSIRQAVSLLRSVETVKAPRSFALAEVPVRADIRTGMRRSRLAMAPAVFAIAAAAAVGLLAVGNLADVVRQSDGTVTTSTERSLTAESSDLAAVGQSSIMSTTTAGGSANTGVAEGVSGAQGPAGSAGPASDGDLPFDDDSQPRVPEFSPLPTTVPEAATAPPGDSVPAAGSSITSDGGTAEQLAPPQSATEPADGAREPMLEFGTGTAAIPQPEDADVPGAIVDDPAAVTGESAEQKSGPDSALPLPEATVTNLLDSTQRLDLTTASTTDNESLSGDDERGVALPLWQLQLGFASLAVVMAGAWILLQRRLTA